MPQATRELQERWQHNEYMDRIAIKHLLDRGYGIALGIVVKPSTVGSDFEPTEEDYSAIDYLCQEWDYGWDG